MKNRLWTNVKDFLNDYKLNKQNYGDYELIDVNYNKEFYIEFYLLIKDKKKKKLVIVNGISRSIIFDNLFDNTFFVYNDINLDKFFYVVNEIDGKITRILNIYKLIIEKEFNIDFPYKSEVIISESLFLKQIEIKKEYIMFNLVNEIDSTLDKKIYNKIGKEVPKKLDSFSRILIFNALGGLKIMDRKFKWGEKVEIHSDLISNDSVVILHYFHESGYDFHALINLNDGNFIDLAPPYCIQYRTEYFLTVPSEDYEPLGSLTIWRVSDLKAIDLDSVDLDIYIKSSNSSISYDTYNLYDNNILQINNEYYHCDNLFSYDIIKDYKNIEKVVFNISPLNSNQFSGYSLCSSGVRNILQANGIFMMKRTYIGNLLYQYKNNFDMTKLDELTQIVAKAIKALFINIDIIIPVPPSNLNRPFQPLLRLAVRVSDLIGVPVDLEFLQKNETVPVKTINFYYEKREILKSAFYVKERKYKNKKILLLDDNVFSGNTLHYASTCIKNYEPSIEIVTLVITKSAPLRKKWYRQDYEIKPIIREMEDPFGFYLDF